MSADPAMPTDEPLAAAESAVARDGGQFRALEGGRIHCYTCGHDADAGDVDASQARRLEGVSDPADELLVVGVTCPSCGTGGSLTLNYGPEATLGDADVLRALDRGRPRPTASRPPARPRPEEPDA